MGQAAEALTRGGYDLEIARPSVLVRAKVDAHTENNFWASLDGLVGGVFIGTHRALPLGELVVLHVRLAGSAEIIRTIAQVRWARPYAGDGVPGLGLEFLDVDDDAFARIRRFATRVREPILFDDD
jgi:Tfp pilus assembly protein PilZ